jgi:hypothetical protein
MDVRLTIRDNDEAVIAQSGVDQFMDAVAVPHSFSSMCTGEPVPAEAGET